MPNQPPNQQTDVAALMPLLRQLVEGQQQIIAILDAWSEAWLEATEPEEGGDDDDD